MQKFMIFLGIGALIVLGVVLAGKAALERKIYGQMTPEMKAQFEDWYNKEIDILEEALEVKPFAPETVAAAVAFRDEWEKVKDSAIKVTSDTDFILKDRAVNVGSPEMVALYEQLPPMEAMLAAFEELVTQPDYEIDALVAGVKPDAPFAGLVPDFRSFQVTIKLQRLRAYQELYEGQPADALQSAESIIRASNASPYSTLISRLIAIAGSAIGTRTWHDVMEQVSDPALLRGTLEAQNKLAPRPELVPTGLDVSVTDQLGTMRQIKRAGIDVKLTGMTGRDYFAEFMRVQKEYNEKIVLPNMPDSPKKENFTNQYGGWSFIAGKHPLIPRFVDRLGSAVLFTISVPNFQEAQTRDNTSRAMFEVLRADTARRLALLEAGATPESIEALAPMWLPEPPVDWHAAASGDDGGDKGVISLAQQGFAYSIGPDKVDQKGALRYDPTNGTVSAGDIFLVRTK